MTPPTDLQTQPEPEKHYFSPGLLKRFDIDIVEISPPYQPTQEQSKTKISFHPDTDTFFARRARTVLTGGLQKSVPDRWPAVLDGRMVWKGSDFDNESDFVYHMSGQEQVEISQALEAFKKQESDPKEALPENFPLPTLAPRLAAACEEIYNGLGAFILRGLDVDKYSPEDLATVFLGVSSYIARKRGIQDQYGTMINHLLDYGSADSQAELPLHTDITCDIVATLTRKCSTQGGMATIASSWAVYNMLAAARPDLVHVLAKPDWPFDTFGREPPYYNRAILYCTDGKPILNFSRRVLTGHPYNPRSPEIPPLSEAQADALDTVHYIAKEQQMKLTTMKGDMRFINNIGLLHGREAFFDDNHERSERHLLRLWLQNDRKTWDLPPALTLAWARVFDDDERESRWDMEPVMISPTNPRPPPAPCD